MWKKIKPYVISIAAALAVGGLSAIFTNGNMDVYKALNQPPLAPPAPVFPIVWSVLFVLMGIGSALVLLNGESGERNSALKLYALQLCVNFFWSIIFFNMQAYLFAFIWLLFLWVLVLAMILKFFRISRTAAYLQIPYILWITFAGYLNLMIFILN